MLTVDFCKVTPEFNFVLIIMTKYETEQQFTNCTSENKTKLTVYE